MAIENKFGKKISYDSTDMIEEIKSDIAEFGNNLEVYGIFKNIDSVEICTDYTYADDIISGMIEDGETAKLMKAADLLKTLEEQDKIL